MGLRFPGKVLVMTKAAETTPEPGSVDPYGEHAPPPRKPYESPRLQEWGSIMELTKGSLSGTVDDDFNGTGGV